MAKFADVNDEKINLLLAEKDAKATKQTVERAVKSLRQYFKKIVLNVSLRILRKLI